MSRWLGEIAWNPQVLGAFFEPSWSVFSAGSGASDLVGGDPNRVLLVVTLSTGTRAFLTPTDEAFGNFGIGVYQDQAPLIIDYARYGALVGYPWQIRFTGLGGQGFFLTQSYRPTR